MIDFQIQVKKLPNLKCIEAGPDLAAPDLSTEVKIFPDLSFHFFSNQINNYFLYFWYIQHISFQLCLLLRKARNIWQFGFGLKRIFWLYFNPNSFGEIGICLNFHLENVYFNFIFCCFNQLTWQLFSIWFRNFDNSLKQSSRIKSISINIK